MDKIALALITIFSIAGLMLLIRILQAIMAYLA